MESCNANAHSEAGERVKGVQIFKPIVYGNVAQYLGRENEKGHTHEWNVYLKAYDNDDMSTYVKRVHFNLHHSYANPIRVCHAPPYQVSETGWGEFELSIKIFFQDSNERPLTLHHFLKLFNREKDGTAIMGRDPVTSEFYDEMVFMDPTVEMHGLLSRPLASPFGTPQHYNDYETKKVTELRKILKSRRQVKNEIEVLRSRWRSVKGEIAILKAQIAI